LTAVARYEFGKSKIQKYVLNNNFKEINTLELIESLELNLYNENKNEEDL
jgi:hypothetical protein